MDANLQLALTSALVPQNRSYLEVVRKKLDDDGHLLKPLRPQELARIKFVQWPDPDGTLVLDLAPGYDLGMDDHFDIASLSGIEACTKLETCIFNALAPNVDLAPLGALSKLQELVAVSRIDENAVTTLAPLATLTRLNRLQVEGPIKDLSPLAKLTKLERLGLVGIHATDLSVLRTLPKLTRVEVSTRAGKHSAHVQTIANELASRGVDVFGWKVGKAEITARKTKKRQR